MRTARYGRPVRDPGRPRRVRGWHRGNRPYKRERIVRVQHGFEFLGYKIKRGKGLRLPLHKVRTRLRPGGLYAYPTQKSLRHFQDQVRSRTRRKAPVSTEVLIEQLNPVLRGWGHYYMRIPVKPITRSGGKPITCSGANRSPVPTQTDHLSERSDAGRNHESRFSVRVDGRLRFRIESPFRSSLYALCTRRSRIALASVGSPMTSCHLRLPPISRRVRLFFVGGPISLSGGGEAGGNWIRQGVVRSGGGSGGRRYFCRQRPMGDFRWSSRAS